VYVYVLKRYNLSHKLNNAMFHLCWLSPRHDCKTGCCEKCDSWNTIPTEANIRNYEDFINCYGGQPWKDVATTLLNLKGFSLLLNSIVS